MNNIYKVIWSKAKNCYVVVSEIARSHTKSASGSEKIGEVARHALLALGAACAIACGGFVNVGAVEYEHVDVQTTGTSTATVYTKNGTESYVDHALTHFDTKTQVDDKIKALKTGDVATNKDNITALQTTTTDHGQKITANTTQIANNTAAIAKKIDTETAEAKLALKANAADVYTKADVNTELAKKADVTALDGKADKSYVDTAVAGAVTTAGTNVDAKLAAYATTAEVDGKIADEVNARNNAITTTIEQERHDRDAAIDNAINGEVTERNQAIHDAIELEKTNRDAAITNAKLELQGKITGEETERKEADTAFNNRLTTAEGKIGANETAIGELKAKDTALEGKINAEKTEREAKDNAILGRIGKVADDGNYIKNSNTNSVSKNLKALDAQAKINADAIVAETAARTNKDTELEGKINTLDGNVTTAQGDINDLKAKDIELEGRIHTNEGNIETNKNAIAAIDKRTAGIGRIDATSETTIENNVKVDSIGNVTAKGQLTAYDGVYTGTGDITTKGDVNAGSLNVENASHLKGDVTMDKTLSVTGDTKLKKTDVDGTLNVTGESSLKNTKVDGTLTTTGKATFQEAVEMDKGLTVTNGATKLKETTVDGKLTAGDADLKDTKVNGKLGVNGDTTLDGALTAKGEATFEKNVTVEKDLTVNGKLNVGEIYLENNKLDAATGKKHDSATAITADGISNLAKVTDHGHTTESQFTHNEKGTINYAKDGDTTDWTETRSDVTANGVKTEAKDSKGNYTNTSQTADGIKGYATDKAGNKTYTKVTATENSFQVQDKDGKNKNHQVNTMDSSVTEIKNAAGATTKTEQTAENITNTAQNGTITNDAQNIVNNASGNMTNTVGGDLTTTVAGNELYEVTGNKTENVTGKVTENYGNGQETNVTGDQYLHVTGKQTNKIDGNQENTIGGNQTTTVTGDISNKAENITNEANTKLTDKVGDNTRVLDSEGITDTVPGADGKGSTFKQRIDAIMGNVKTDAGESEVTQKGDEITSVVGKGEATNSRVTQKKGSLEAGVTDGTNTNASYDVADASAKELTDGTKVNKVLDNLDSSEKTITNGTYKTSKLQTALDITNTAKDGTITNDAKNIVNNATGDMTNTVGGKLTTTVTGQATENFKGGLKTDITGEEIHTVTGNQTNKVTGKQTNTVEGGQENIISGGQINNITGDQTTTISGTQTTTATDINRNASSSMVDKVDNAYGTNTETKEAGKTTTDVSIKGTGEKGQYIRGANESRDYLIKGTLKNSETKTAEATSTKITDGNGKISSTIQDVTQISGSVTDGTNTSVSNVKANSIDSAVTDGSSISTINQKKNSITSQVTDGTTITKTEQDTKNITNTAKDGTITNDAKDIVNNASGNMTNTVGGDLTTTVSGNELHEVDGKQTNKIDGDQENTIGGNQTTTVTGDISNKAENITNEANTKLTDKVGDHTRVLDSEGITDTVGGSTFKQRIDKIMMESKDVSIKAEETLTNEAKVITNKASEVINNEAVNINNTATGIITSKASEIKNQADKLISNKVGENTWENMENGKITTSIKDGAKQNLTQSDAAGTTQSTVDGGKSTVTIQNADGLADAVTDGTNTSVQNQTASAIAAAVKDGAGNENASVANATTSANTIKSGSKVNTVISTADGTSFINSEAAAPVGDGTEVKTTIKGNTITTGKVTMDYAEVMKDLGVRGNANITGKTTTGSLEVTGTSTLKGDVTMESNATVKKDLTVEGNTNLKNTKVDGTLDVTQKATFGDSVSIAKDLSVDGNATIKGDVTAKSYKVGDKTYISAAGINANDQKITNVADGSISEGSKDAVNGGQLYTVKNDLEGKVNKVGANAAAMANLHPMEFDPDSKWNVAAAIGNYGSETAAALGAFYRPNDDVMVNLSTAFGTGENMVGGGVSVRLGKGGNKLSREENNALKAQVADLTARMDALLSVLNPNMSKDFPDVPENHWAYEAVSRLAGNDIVQGYPDGEFHGERTMTRYEMAEIIYKALQKGAKAEAKLVEEFKPELKAMAAQNKA